MNIEIIKAKASQYLKEGRYNSAVTILSTLKSEQLDYSTFNIFSECYWRLDQIDKALVFSELAIESTESINLKKFHRGFGFYISKDWEGAIRELDWLDDPIIARFFLGLSYFRDKQWSLSENALTEYLKVQNDFTAFFFRARARYFLQNFGGAIEDFTEYVAKSNNLIQVSDAYSFRAACFQSIGDFESAEADFKKALEIKPNSFYAIAGLAHLAIGKIDYRQAISFATKAIEINSEDDDPKMIRASALLLSGKFEESKLDFESTKKFKERDPRLLVDYSAALIGLAKFDEASEILTDTIEVSNGDLKAYAMYNRGRIPLVNQNATEIDITNAIEDFQQAFILERSMINAKVNEGYSWHKLGDLEQAKECYMLAPDHALANTNLGSIYMVLGNQQDALKAFNRGVKLGPEFYQTWRSRAIFRAKEKKWSLASADFQNAISKYTESGFENETSSELIIWSERANFNLKVRKRIFGQGGRDALKAKRVFDELLEFQKNNSKAEISDGESFVHYTSLNTVFSLFNSNGETPFLRAGEVSYMNDSNEGKELSKLLEILKPGEQMKDFLEEFENYLRQYQVKAFSISFLKNTEIKKQNNSLLLWRLYGKGGDGREAGGCSITVKRHFFNHENDPSNRIEIRNFENEVFSKHVEAMSSTSLFDPFKVQYVDSTNMQTLDSLIEPMLKIWKLAGDDSVLKNHVFNEYLSLMFLFKSKDYEYEDEVRLLHYRPFNYKYGIKTFKPGGPTDGPRIYLNYEKSVLPYITEIWVGPNVQDKEYWKTYLEFKKQELGLSFEIKESKLNFK